MGNLGERTGTKETNITNRIEEMKGRVSGIEDMIEKKKDTPIKESEFFKDSQNNTIPTLLFWGEVTIGL